MRPEGMCNLIKLNYLTGSQTRDLPAYGTVSQPLRYAIAFQQVQSSFNINMSIARSKFCALKR
jgi:hypothetical protein